MKYSRRKYDWCTQNPKKIWCAIINIRLFIIAPHLVLALSNLHWLFASFLYQIFLLFHYLFAALHSLHIVTAIFTSYSTFRLLKAIAKSIEHLYIWLFLVKLSLLTLFAFFLVSVLCFFFDGFLSKVIALPTIAIWKSYNYIERAIKKRRNIEKNIIILSHFGCANIIFDDCLVQG